MYVEGEKCGDNVVMVVMVVVIVMVTLYKWRW